MAVYEEYISHFIHLVVFILSVFLDLFYFPAFDRLKEAS